MGPIYGFITSNPSTGRVFYESSVAYQVSGSEELAIVSVENTYSRI